ncbi:MAG: response regulator receiver protein [Geobacteraceae bacterium]|jgi:CheY-like chemotaxis protein|nr:response regulator receiver protein [Geobacteraceae bacterium]
MGKILIIDDDQIFLEFLREYIEEYYPLLQVQTCTNPLLALKSIKKDLDLLIVDLEMPAMDGNKIITYAAGLGMNRSRIILLSSHDADYLHEHFPMGTCLAVLNKYEAGQKAVLDMIFNSLEKKVAE